MEPVDPGILKEILVAIALGALVGIEREQAPDRKYAGIRTLSILTASGALVVGIGEMVQSAAPVLIYLAFVAILSLSIIYVRLEVQDSNIGFTTSTTVFLLGLVGVLVGYGRYFPAVAIVLIVVFMLSEKESFQRYVARFHSDDLSDAITVGILALVIYPILPEGAVDPYGVLFLRKALLFVILILMVQFAAFISLQWWKIRIGMLAAAAVGGVVSSLAVATTMIEYVAKGRLSDAAYSATLAASVAMIARNGALAVALSPGFRLLRPIIVPFGLAVAVGTGFVVMNCRRASSIGELDFGTESPFSFRSAFQFGVLFLAILMLSELATTYLRVFGAYGAAFLGGFGSSTAVVASAATLLSAGSMTETQAAIMVSLGIIASLLSKLFYSEVGGARQLTLRLLAPYALMGATILGGLLL
ncbi:MgtC/SapB family protein [Halanaeroarchaeum sulfurireducens]|uniref:Putative membrane protein n=1 Tax=Halanaeroarchaeum sulfurireducens TaxID=1604004 RepID=A0A0N9ML55_9EURY|nr:MgtC/SapB family protein [Halanaeroarchaeum sulfurireducens]ALG82986.1 putative membrane protein [Halanaeroarchaeum sulfurireducens]